MNAVRINLQYLQWQAAPAEQAEIFETFLDIAARHKIRAVPCLFDDCGFSGDPATADLQPDPRPGVHNGRALASPGREIVMDQSAWPQCLGFLRDVMMRFGDHPNVLFWDIYNEPGNGSIFLSPTETDDISARLNDLSLALFEQVFDAAIAIDPIHPITSGAWRHWSSDGDRESEQAPFQNEIDQVMLRRSDIVTFHGYVTAPRMAHLISYLEAFDRPIYCTEWMARHAGSRILDQLQILRDRSVGAFQWGLVQGRSQTHLPWPHVNAQLQAQPDVEPEWFHDLLYPDGAPYNPAEVETMKTLVGS